MDQSSVFVFLSSAFEAAKVPVVLIGGYAVIAHKVPRNTLDVDFMVTEGDFSKILDRLDGEGYIVANRQSVFAQCRSSRPGRRDLDFMFVDRETLESIMKEGISITIAGHSFTVPSIRHLIALKLHSIKHNPHRELKDLPDIVNLVEANGLEVEAAEFKDLCLKYGTHPLYELIRSKAGKLR